MDNKILEITALCINIRKALESKSLTNLFKDFPFGCCRDASLLTSLFLKDSGCLDVSYCSKEIDEISPSHAWLEYDGFIIDITGDQFGLDLPSVVIVPVSEAAFLYQSHIRQLADLSIAGMDSIEIIKEYERVKEYLSRYDVKNYLSKFMPSLLELLGSQNISWSAINRTFRESIKAKKNALSVNSDNLSEATFYTILIRKQYGFGDTDAMFSFFDSIFESLNSILSHDEKKPLHRMITRVLSTLNKSYLNFIGELATLNFYMKKGKYDLIDLEERIHPQSNISADIFLRDKNDNSEILIEVLNIHLENYYFEDYNDLERHLRPKLLNKIKSKIINPDRNVIIQPVIWISSEQQLHYISNFYIHSRFSINHVELPLVYRSYRLSDSTFEHKFGYI